MQQAAASQHSPRLGEGGLRGKRRSFGGRAEAKGLSRLHLQRAPPCSPGVGSGVGVETCIEMRWWWRGEVAQMHCLGGCGGLLSATCYLLPAIQAQAHALCAMMYYYVGGERRVAWPAMLASRWSALDLERTLRSEIADSKLPSSNTTE